eukprot:TRINITY_DN56760_c0_g1_i1.p2 TRINITY_DN56760_c0_g1~~TRINITY_DN56760_c0_g1_i1.p2  ORF type:complete len:134 (-),score=20.29 TRINITY_DN56760_c0_g1_i1:154-555(-)
MGGAASEPAKKVITSGALRRAGDNLNTLGFPVVHEQIFQRPAGKPTRTVVCRCWQSMKFPLCDNTHQRLQKQGINCGPVMLEIKAGPTPVTAGSGGETTPMNLGARAFVGGGVLATATAAAVQAGTGTGPFPF